MAKIEDIKKDESACKEHAFLLQFEGEDFDVRTKLGMNSYSYYGGPIGDMQDTGLFGILDALFDLGLTAREILDFYIHGHVEPYDDAYKFTEGIIKIVNGMPSKEIKSEYGRYFNDERIKSFANISKNTAMLLSFCYDKDDTYEYIADPKELYSRFEENYNKRYHDYFEEYQTKKEFPKIDGKLFRAVRFLALQGYDFPAYEVLANEQIKDIELKQTNGDKPFILNKEFARMISDNILSLVCFLKRKEYDFINPETMFDPNCDNIIIVDKNGNQINFSRSNLVPDINRYTEILYDLNHLGFETTNTIDLCDKRINSIELQYTNGPIIEHTMTINRDLLDTKPMELFRVIKKAFLLGFAFPDNDNLFDISKKMLKVKDPNGKEYPVVREQFDNMLEIIIKCRNSGFSVNYTQLFDTSRNDVEIFDDEEQKVSVNRDQMINMMDLYELLIQNGYRSNDYSNLFDESKPYIVCFDKENNESIISRKQINKIIRVQKLSNKSRDDLTEQEKDILLMLENDSIRRKLFKWLPYTAKKWIPSSAVISKIPAEQSHEYFYNNNHTRLKTLKDEYQASSYTDMEGIISLGYILGLFDSKESTSEKAMNYIIEYFIKKGTTADELHTTYGAIDLSKGYNKKFADFFMQHYASDIFAFVEPDVGTNMVGELFERFDEILESRPEKKIKTRTINKLLTPLDAMAAITNIKIDKTLLGSHAEDERYLALVGLLMKFGASNQELKWAINLYEQALAIDEANVKIPYLEDLKANLMQFNSHLKSDPHAFLSGRKTNCCSRYGGLAQDRLTHVITDPNWRYITFTSPNKTFFDGLVWYDEEEKIVCIDNVEGQFSSMDKSDPKSVALMADAVIRYADEVYKKMHDLDIPCVKVNVGKDSGTASWAIFRYAWEQKLINEDKHPCDYPRRNHISSDARQQFTITDENTLKLRNRH